jgi:hypothetical protein
MSLISAPSGELQMLSPVTVSSKFPKCCDSDDGRTYNDESHLSNAAKKTIERRSTFNPPPITNVRHELSPRYAHRPTRSNTEALVGNEHT